MQCYKCDIDGLWYSVFFFIELTIFLYGVECRLSVYTGEIFTNY